MPDELARLLRPITDVIADAMPSIWPTGVVLRSINDIEQERMDLLCREMLDLGRHIVEGEHASVRYDPEPRSPRPPPSPQFFFSGAGVPVVRSISKRRGMKRFSRK